MFWSISVVRRSVSAIHSTASSPVFAATAGREAVRSHSWFATTSGPGALGSTFSTVLRFTPFALLSRSVARYTKPSPATVMPSASGPAAPALNASFGKRARLPFSQPATGVAEPSAATASFQNVPVPLSTAHKNVPSAVT